MASGMHKIIVVDIESTCWEGRPPPGEEAEIIEIGLTVLDPASKELSDRRAIIVRPQRSKVSNFCTRLTTLTQEDVDAGVSFAEACDILEREYDTRERLWVSWGDYDRQSFEAQCIQFGVGYPFSDRHLNAKRLFASLRGEKRVGLAGALERIGLMLEGTHHRGVDDAWNIARVLVHLLETFGQDILVGV